jgi:hypothetical protein
MVYGHNRYWPLVLRPKVVNNSKWYSQSPNLLCNFIVYIKRTNAAALVLRVTGWNPCLKRVEMLIYFNVIRSSLCLVTYIYCFTQLYEIDEANFSSPLKRRNSFCISLVSSKVSVRAWLRFWRVQILWWTKSRQLTRLRLAEARFKMHALRCRPLRLTKVVLRKFHWRHFIVQVSKKIT